MKGAHRPAASFAAWTAAAWVGAGGVVAAQQAPTSPPPSNSSAQIDAGEPRADTSSVSPSAASSPERGPRGGASSRSSTRAAAAGHAAPSGQKASGVADRVDLSTATVTGDREQPKVMYIVPWKRSDIGDLSGKPMNSLLDEALAPVDRDEFKREVAYYDAVRADASQNGSAKAKAKQGEK